MPASRIVHEKGNINPSADILGRLPSLRRVLAGPGYDDDNDNSRNASTASFVLVDVGT